MEKLKILLVDDLEYLHVFFQFKFKHTNYSLISALSGEEAMLFLYENEVDIIFMDIEMPKFTGIEITHRIRTEFTDYKKDLPIIAITAHDEKEYLENLKNIGFNDYISKQFEHNEIFKVIDKYVLSKNKRNYSLSFKDNNPDFDKELEKTLVTYFVENTPDVIKKLSNAAIEQNEKQIKDLCHKLGNQLLYFGLDKAAGIVELLENSDLKTYPKEKMLAEIALVGNDCALAISELKKDYEL